MGLTDWFLPVFWFLAGLWLQNLEGENARAIAIGLLKPIAIASAFFLLIPGLGNVTFGLGAAVGSLVVTLLVQKRLPMPEVVKSKQDKEEE